VEVVQNVGGAFANDVVCSGDCMEKFVSSNPVGILPELLTHHSGDFLRAGWSQCLLEELVGSLPMIKGMFIIFFASVSTQTLADAFELVRAPYSMGICL
jgi:hypothetical protein